MVRGIVVAAATLGLSLLVACGDETGDGGGPQIAPLTVTTSSLARGRLRTNYSAELEATDGVKPYKFEIVDGMLPRGLSLDDEGGIDGVPLDPGPFEITVRVTDAQPDTAEAMVFGYVIPDPLQIETASLPDGQEGTAYTHELVSSGGVPPNTWSVVQGNLPAGMMLSTEGELSGTPSEFGGFDFTVEVQDSEGTVASQPLHLFLQSLFPMITTATVPRGRVGSSFSQDFRFAAEGGQAPYSWSSSAGTLPDGLQIAIDGSFGGVPTVDGRFRFTVAVEDSALRRDEADFTVDVVAPLSIATTSLPQAIRGRSYFERIEAQGGVPPYRFRVRDARCDDGVTSGLPPGLTLSEEGVLSGTTNAMDNHCFTVSVQDDEGFVALTLFTMEVNDRFIYEVTPNLAFPAVCTSTKVSWVSVPIEVPDSYDIETVEVLVDVTYSDREERSDRENQKLKLMLFGPDGSLTPLCGNGAGVRGWRGCDGSGGIQETYNDNNNPAQRPLAAFKDTNARGTWYFSAVVAKPTTDSTGCQQAGTINRVRLSMWNDDATEPYIHVGGFTKNNLTIEPWVRLSSQNASANRQLQLTATIYDVGPNGRREAGAGDDIPQPMPLMWRNTLPPPVGSMTPGGLVTAGTITGEAMVIAESPGLTSKVMTLRVLPPDWNPMVRDY